MMKHTVLRRLNEATQVRHHVLSNVAIIVLMFGLGLSSTSLSAQQFGEGPMSLFIAYQCEPRTKGAFRSYMAGPGVQQFESWKEQGVYRDYLVLFSSFVNVGETAPDMLVRLDFARYADSAKWKEIERTSPAGLSEKAHELCRPVTSYLADLVWEGGPSANRDHSKAVYLSIPYQFNLGKPQYMQYFDAYVKPQNDGWLDNGVLSWWGVYINQHMTGKPWDALFLYEYADIAALARRDNVKEAVRAKLRKDPAWKSVSDNKQQYRTEDQVIIMDPILPRP